MWKVCLLHRRIDESCSLQQHINYIQRTFFQIMETVELPVRVICSCVILEQVFQCLPLVLYGDSTEALEFNSWVEIIICNLSRVLDCGCFQRLSNHVTDPVNCLYSIRNYFQSFFKRHCYIKSTCPERSGTFIRLVLLLQYLSPYMTSTCS